MASRLVEKTGLQVDYFLQYTVFRVVLLRRSTHPLSQTVRNCHPLDSRGHHCAVCAHTGVSRGRKWEVENAAARICHEAGGRVTTNVVVSYLDLAAPHVDDARRLEVVADGLPLFGGAQLAADTTPVKGCAARWSGTEVARLRKARTFPELIWPHRWSGRSKWVW